MTEKVCPILTAFRLSAKKCLGEDCALWLDIQKEAPNPFGKYVYRGCGLANHIPWKSVEKGKARGDSSGGASPPSSKEEQKEKLTK